MPQVFRLIQKYGPVSEEEMYQVYNMGIGFCIVLPEEEVDHAMQIAEKHDASCYEIGHMFKDHDKTVILEQPRLRSNGKRFVSY